MLDIVVVGNADGESEFFALPKAYNETLGTRVRHLREDHGIQTVDTTVMLGRTVRYDKLHLEDEPINRLVVSFLRAVVGLQTPRSSQRLGSQALMTSLVIIIINQ